MIHLLSVIVSWLLLYIYIYIYIYICMKDVAISLYFVKWTHFLDFLANNQVINYLCETWIQNIQFIINLELQGYLDDNLRCAGILVLLFVCLFVCLFVL